MELRPRKGRSAQSPSTPTAAVKASSRKHPNLSSRKQPASVLSFPTLIASGDDGTNPRQGSSPAPNQEYDSPLSAGTPFSDFVKSRRKAVSSTTKKSEKLASIRKNKATEAISVTELDTTSLEEAHTANDCNTIASEIVRLDDTATRDEIAAVEGNAAESIEAKTSIVFVGEKFFKKDMKLQSAKKKSPTKRFVEKSENGGLPDEVGNIKLNHVDDQDHSLVADAPVLAVSNEYLNALSLVLSDDESGKVSGAMQTHVCMGKQDQDLKSSSKKKSRFKRDNYIEKDINRNLFEENAAIVLSPTDREPEDLLKHGMCDAAKPSKDGETEMDNGNIQEAGGMVNSISEEQCSKPCTESSKESLQSDTVMLVFDEANCLKGDEAVEGEDFGDEFTRNNVREDSSLKSDAAAAAREDCGNELIHRNVPEESSHRECKMDEELGNGQDDFSGLKLKEVKGGSVFNDDDNNIEDDNSDDDGSCGSDEDEGDLASIFASSMKAHLHIFEPSALGKSKEMQSELNAPKGRKSPLTKDAAKVSSGNGSRSVGSELSWLPKIAFSPSKNHRSQARILETRPNNIWEKDRCLQDGVCVPPVDPVKLNKLAKKQKKDTAGDKWYNLSAPTITPELKKELQLVKLRGVLDPKRHYKSEDSKGLPKYFQVGTVVGGPADFYSGRLTKKEQKGSLANELLSDTSLSTYRKRKYLEVQDKKQAGGKGFFKKNKSKRTPAWAKI